VPELRYLRRFSWTERALHWVHIIAFFLLLGSGLVLNLSRLSELVSRRPLVKARSLSSRMRQLGREFSEQPRRHRAC